MRLDLDPEVQVYIRRHRVGRLATADDEARPLVIPICYVFDGSHFYSPLDAKPKTVSLNQLRRVRNLTVNPRFSLVIDEYSEDWSELSYVLISGNAEVITPDDPLHAAAVAALREKYEQYRVMDIGARPMIRLSPDRIKQWRASDALEV